MDQLITALEANWDGYEEMRLDFVKNAPKWGNDDDYVDDIMLKCLREAAAFLKSSKTPAGTTGRYCRKTSAVIFTMPI